MAMTFSGTAITDAATLSFDESHYVRSVYVSNTGAVALLVNVPDVHGATSYDTVQPGETGTYIGASIRTILVKTGASTTTYTAGPIQANA